MSCGVLSAKSSVSASLCFSFWGFCVGNPRLLLQRCPSVPRGWQEGFVSLKAPSLPPPPSRLGEQRAASWSDECRRNNTVDEQKRCACEEALLGPSRSRSDFISVTVPPQPALHVPPRTAIPIPTADAECQQLLEWWRGCFSKQLCLVCFCTAGGWETLPAEVLPLIQPCPCVPGGGCFGRSNFPSCHRREDVAQPCRPSGALCAAVSDEEDARVCPDPQLGGCPVSTTAPVCFPSKAKALRLSRCPSVCLPVCCNSLQLSHAHQPLQHRHPAGQPLPVSQGCCCAEGISAWAVSGRAVTSVDVLGLNGLSFTRGSCYSCCRDEQGDA